MTLHEVHGLQWRMSAHPRGITFIRGTAGRRSTHQVLTPQLFERFPGRDWMLTRLLWLEGLERGVNRGGEVDTLRRFIYIHGTHDELHIGQPTSQGCVLMRSDHIVELFDGVENGALVELLL